MHPCIVGIGWRWWMRYCWWKESGQPVEVGSWNPIICNSFYVFSGVSLGFLNHQQHHQLQVASFGTPFSSNLGAWSHHVTIGMAQDTHVPDWHTLKFSVAERYENAVEPKLEWKWIKRIIIKVKGHVNNKLSPISSSSALNMFWFWKA